MKEETERLLFHVDILASGSLRSADALRVVLLYKCGCSLDRSRLCVAVVVFRHRSPSFAINIAIVVFLTFIFIFTYCYDYGIIADIVIGIFLTSV